MICTYNNTAINTASIEYVNYVPVKIDAYDGFLGKVQWFKW